ncbi:MAG: hypothetical protein JOZ16_01485 [Methylobacteriaceae bacterium]|nr:hypothetical protein [Methylobacteriaceae bacterium]
MLKAIPLIVAGAIASATAMAPQEAAARHGYGGGHFGHHRAFAHFPGRAHGGWHRPWHYVGGWRHAGWRHWHARPIAYRPYPAFRGPRRVIFVGGFYRPRPIYARPIAYGGNFGCSTRRSVGFAPWGGRKIVTTRICYVP